MRYRSWLCSNGLKGSLSQKCRDFKADIAHLDLEDSVPMDQKDLARNKLEENLHSIKEFTSALRVNTIWSVEGLKDLLLLNSQPILPNILIIPKSNLDYDIDFVFSVMGEKAKSMQIFAVIETAKTLMQFLSLKTAPHGLSGVIFGSADFAADIGGNIDTVNLEDVKLRIAWQARALKLIAIDTPCFDFNDSEKLKEELDYVSKVGFHGKIAIHPNQIEEINASFSPSSNEVENALTIKNCLSQNQIAISSVKGRMIGPPFLKSANKCLEEYFEKQLGVTSVQNIE